MDFFRSQWAPVRSVQPEFQFKVPHRRTPKVVQIPVHFVGSESARSTSALKIQKVFRGFLVRKSVKKILSIKREVDAIEAGISQVPMLDLIRKVAKERLKVNETLMALLFKLDSVPGVDSGVRVCRRAVIKKAIALQERVDAIANDPIQHQTLAQHLDHDASEDTTHSDDQIQNQNSYNVVVLDDGSGESSEDGNKAECFSDDVMSYEESMSNACDNKGDGGDSAEEDEFVEQKGVENCDKDQTQEIGGGDSEMKGDDYNSVEEGKIEIVEGDNASSPELQADSSFVEEVDRTPGLSECVEKSVDEGNNDEKEIDALEMMGGDGKKDGGDDNKKSRELQERMMEDNGKMMKMMSELFERNDAQARMLNTLTHRLEQLEKAAFVCDRIRRKKKRHCVQLY